MCKKIQILASGHSFHMAASLMLSCRLLSQVQELHEEEALWVNYDEDELFVKMQLADGIFDALLKDTAEILIQIQEKRSKRPKL